MNDNRRNQLLQKKALLEQLLRLCQETYPDARTVNIPREKQFLAELKARFISDDRVVAKPLKKVA